MKKVFFTAAAIIAVIFACSRLPETSNPNPSGPPIKNCFCVDTTQGNTLCSQLPIDVTEQFGFGYSGSLTPQFQPPFDVFSWQTFIALNWPFDAKGQPMPGTLGQNTRNPRVWEQYTDPEQIFGAGNSPLVLGITEAAAKGQKFFYRFAKSPHPLLGGTGSARDFGDEEADGHALIDRNLNFAVFEIKVNPEETQFIRDHHLNSLVGIDSFYHQNKDAFHLPASQFPSTVGSMEIKAAWRILDPSLGDDTTRYYTRDAVIQIAKENSATGQAFTVQAKVGLVGLHIIRKTGNFNFMIWSTFEHVDNTPDDVQAAQTGQDTSKRWSFYNVQCLTCPVNTAPIPDSAADGKHYKWNAQPPYASKYAITVAGEQGGRSFGSQITRTYPIYYRTQQVNQLWQAKLQGTVWANYRLVGSQWTVANDGSGNKPTINVPSRLGNTTQESFIQLDASCISCHRHARVIVGKDTIPTDLSFLFGAAK